MGQQSALPNEKEVLLSLQHIKTYFPIKKGVFKHTVGYVKAVDDVRAGKGPVLIESVTYRWFGHSSSDPGKYRTKEEVDGWKLKDPNLKFRNYLLENNIATEEELVELEQKSKKQIEDAVEFAKNSPEPTLESAFEDIFAN